MEIEVDLDPWQWEIINDQHPVKCAVVGRRAGKTTMMLIWLAIMSQKYPGTKCWYAAPTYARCMSAKKALATSPGFMSLVKRSYAQFPIRYEMKSGASIEFRSLDRGHFKNAKGEGLKACAFDESALLDADAYFEVVRPMLLDTNGSVILGSTYRGRNWFYHLAEQGKLANERVRTWVFPSSVGREFQGPEGLKRLAEFKAECAARPGKYEEECMCIPLSGTDCAFRYVERCEVDATPPSGPRLDPATGRPCRYAMSVDLGRTPDYGFVVILELETGMIVVAEQLPQIEHALQAVRCREYQDKWRPCFVIVDSTGGATGGKHDSYVAEYRRFLPGLREFHWSRDNKRLLVGEANLRMEQRKIKIPRAHAELLSQLKLYKYKMSEFGLFPTFGAPTGEHDDGCAALMQLIWAQTQNWIPDHVATGPASLLY